MAMTQTLTRPPTRADTTEDATDTAPMPMELRFEPAIEMTEDLFTAFCAQNSDMRIELTAEGVLEIMPPTKGDTGSRELDIAADLKIWSRADGSGVAFGPTAGFTLPNNAIRSPDASWVLRSRLAALTDEDKNRFIPLCPDFVVELRSSTDRLSVVQAKMAEYIANGARLGWLIDPIARRVYVYRPNAPVQVLDAPDTLSAEPELAGFALNLTPIWTPAF